jgi:hypothetical protein
MKIIVAPLLVAVMAGPSAAQTVQIQTFDHEQIHVRISGGQQVEGWLLMEDVGDSHSRLELLVRNVDTTEIVYQCITFEPIDALPGEGDDSDIVQVGQFAQQATADAAAIMDSIGADCNPARRPRDHVTLDCPFLGERIATAPQHVSFNQSGTYRAANQQLTSFRVAGHRDRALCTLDIDDELFEVDGFLTRLKATHQGSPSPVLFWEIPTGWLLLRDVLLQLQDGPTANEGASVGRTP